MNCEGKTGILFVSDGYNSPYPGNYIPSMKALAESLKADYANVVFAMDNKAKSRYWCQEMLEEGYRIEFFDFTKKKISTLFKLFKLIKRENIKIVHKHFGDNFYPLILSRLLRKVRFLIHIHSDWSHGNEGAYKKALKQRLKDKIGYKICRVAVSEKLAEQENGIYVPNRLVLSRRRILTEQERCELRDSVGIGRDKKLLLVLGWSPLVKGVDIAVNAVKKLREEGKDFELAVVSGEKSEIVTNFISEKTGVQNAEYIHIIPPTRDVFEYYGIADIMLCSSRSEGFSYSLLENISIKNPTIAADILGHTWAKCFEGVTFFESQNADALKEAF